MPTPEGKVKQRIKALFKEYGVYSFMPVQSGFGSVGLDFHAIHHGVGFCVEAKRPGGTPTARQFTTMEAVRAAGGYAFVVADARDLERLEEWLRRCCKHHQCQLHPFAPQPASEEEVWLDDGT